MIFAMALASFLGHPNGFLQVGGGARYVCCNGLQRGYTPGEFCLLLALQAALEATVGGGGSVVGDWGVPGAVAEMLQSVEAVESVGVGTQN